MPNWATTKLVISGDDDILDELVKQVSQPYLDDHNGKEQEITGNFLLWNIIRPTNLDAYYQRGDYAEPTREPNPDISVDDIVTKITKGMEEGMDWYYWNIRNWGTKWEIGEDQSWVSRKPREVSYELQTAWSPPVEALDNLAKQYPTLTFTLKSIDEGDLFACEIAWNNGERSYEIDLPINHATYDELYGECWVCRDGLVEPDSPDFDPECDQDTYTAQEEHGCREFQNLDLEVELGL